MSLSDWFSARERRRYTRAGESPAVTADVPDGVWIKCDSCKRTLYEGELIENLRVCKHCGHHFSLDAWERIALIADEGTFVETEAGMTACDPLSFVATKSYQDSLASSKSKSGLQDAIVTGLAELDGRPLVLGVMDFRFIGASMGSVVGEKVARAFELATSRRLPMLFVISSGGARMQEGMLSLMQMAKTSAAAQRHIDAGLPYISVLAHPTYGGVTASFPVLADVIVAEPGAAIGFTGPRVIEQTIRQSLPKGFQTAEFLVQHGMIDEVVRRSELKSHLATLLGYLVPRADRVGGGER